MGLLGRIFKGDKEREGGDDDSHSRHFHESESTSDDSLAARNAPRRELVQVVLRDTMRKHGIPSDWLECRILSTVSRSGRPGLLVSIVVRQAHAQMLAYVFAFQDSFEREIARYEPRARDWLLSIAWEFPDAKPEAMPTPQGWQASASAPLVPELPRAVEPAFAPTEDPEAFGTPRTEEDIQRDLEALFAIRDAAMAATAAQPGRSSEPPGFEPTRPPDQS